MTPKVLLAVDSLSPGNGGICRVARLMAKVVSEEARSGRLTADAIVLADNHGGDCFGVPYTTAASSRLRFAAHVQAASLSHTHFLYDFAGISRAHCRIPAMKRPAMTWIHGIEVWEDAVMARIRSAKRADMLLVNSQYTRDRANRLYGDFSRAAVCWLGTESDEAPPASQPPVRPTVTIIARLDRYKGHDELIDCWPHVTSAVRDARLRIVGRGPRLTELKQRAGASPAASAIEFTGFVPEEQMPAIWAGTTVLAMPSRGEGFGLVYIEAMSHGIPVIASVHDAAPEVNLDGVTGFNVDLDVPQELPDRIVDLLRVPSLAERMGAAGRARWMQHFRYTSFRDRFVPFLNEFIRTGQGR